MSAYIMPAEMSVESGTAVNRRRGNQTFSAALRYLCFNQKFEPGFGEQPVCVLGAEGGCFVLIRHPRG